MEAEESVIEKQRVWRCYSNGENSGYFVWNVLEVIGEQPYDEKLFEKCRDDSFILIACDHFWTADRARKHLLDKEEWEQITIIL